MYQLAAQPTRKPAYPGDRPVDTFIVLAPLDFPHGSVDIGDKLVATHLLTTGLSYLYRETGTGNGMKWEPLTSSPGPVELLLENEGLSVGPE